MAFPTSPTDGQQATVANVVYQYETSTNSWTRLVSSIGNLTVTGYISAAGNITSNGYILGNGALLTGVITSVSNINSGNSNVSISSANANVTVGVSGVANVVVIAPTGTGNVVSVLGNVSGEYYYGNGSQLTGISTGNSAITVTSSTITANFTIANGQNGLSVGPVTYANNVQVTVASGQRWIIL